VHNVLFRCRNKKLVARQQQHREIVTQWKRYYEPALGAETAASYCASWVWPQCVKISNTTAAAAPLSATNQTIEDHKQPSIACHDWKAYASKLTEALHGAGDAPRSGPLDALFAARHSRRLFYFI
jgi:hypothetical protein